MVTIASRASWGARHPNGGGNLSGLGQEVFLHHTVTATLPEGASIAQEQAAVRQVEQIGQDRFRQGISYNFLVFNSGRIYEGVSHNRLGAHTGGRNSTSRSIVFVGNAETNRPSEAAIDAMRRLMAHGRGRFWVNNAPLRPHSAVSATACPGQHLRNRIADILRAAPAAPANGSLANVAPFTAWVTSETLNFRSGPGTNHPIVAALRRGEPRVFNAVQTVAGQRWYRTQAGNWASGAFLTGTNPNPPPPPAPAVEPMARHQRWVSVPVANFRRGPGTNHALVTQLPRGDVRWFNARQRVANQWWFRTESGSWASETVLTDRRP